MTWIKICGITNLEDAQTAVEAGADGLGFVFYPKSLRRVDAGTVRAIAAAIPANVEKIGVFVGAPLAAIEGIGLTGVQLHFTSAPDGGPRHFSAASLRQYLALPAKLIRAGIEPASFLNGPVEAIFLDSGTADQPGGTGKTFDWKKAESMVRHLSKTYRVVVAGGLSPDNVADAIRILKPWGVDVSSGVEARPGKKDPQKIRAFINAVRQVEVSV
jgi:phosphoribosylanthranilate isomerase